MENTILHIALPSPLYNHFDYLPPTDGHIDDLSVGVRVRVPFGRREMVGIVVGFSDNSPFPRTKLKPVFGALDEKPVLGEAMLHLCHWAANYYHHPLGEVLAAALPSLLRQGLPATFVQQTCYKLSASGQAISPATLSRAPKQARLLQLLHDHPQGINGAMLKQHEINTAQRQALQKKGWIESFNQAVTPSTTAKTTQIRSALTLNQAQQQAVQQILAQQQSFSVHLLHGITGSGKTEVYLRCISETLAQGKQALVLIPEIALTPQTVARFNDYFPGRQIAVLHSALNDRERLDAWLLSLQGNIDIVIGTRSAIFTPLPQLGMIIIDEEHDTSFKQQDGFRYCARNLAIMRAKHANIPIVLGSATPSLESWHNSQQQRYHYLCLTERATGASLPDYQLIDLRQHSLDQGLSQPLLDAIKAHLAREEQVMLFINRRGFAPVLLCHDCGWSAHCTSCDANMVRHHARNFLQCHHCGNTRRCDTHCPECHSNQLISIGSGTERIEQVLQQQFPDANILRIDRDSTRRKGSLQALLDKVHQGKQQILVGTQMLAKGHHFPRMTLVGVLDTDGGLYSSDFRATERMAQLLLQVAGRAGREDKPGRVLIQTHNPDHPLLQTLLQHGYGAFAQATLQERQNTHLPPFSHVALLRCESTQEQQGLQFLQHIKSCLAPHVNNVQLLGPAPAIMQRRAGRFRAQLLLQSQQRSSLHQAIGLLINTLREYKAPRLLRWALDVDPQEM